MHSGEFEKGRSDLREAAETVEQALAEACASGPVQEADTGELIRVEEMLALASDAARRAISIRRKGREVASTGAEQPPPAPEGTSLPDGSQPTATHRQFEDARGVAWDVWAVYPEGRPSQLSALPGTFQSGWLVFESALEKRRLSPIPSGWLALSPGELEQLCAQASSASRRARGGRRRGEDDTTPPRD